MNHGVNLKTYGDLPGINHPEKRLSDFLPNDYIWQNGERWSNPKGVVPHNDPNFRHATSGEYWRGSTRIDDPARTHGRLPVAWKDIKPEDVEARKLWIFFVERLASFSGQSDYKTMRLLQKKQNGIYIIGAMLASELVDISVVGWESVLESDNRTRSSIVENFHFRRVKDEPVIAIGNPSKTRLYQQAIPLNFVIDGRTGVTDTGKLLGVTQQDQVRFKYVYDPEVVARLVDLGSS